MAVITKAIQSRDYLQASLIPADIMKAIPQAELLDRLAYARSLSRQSRAATDPVLRKGYAQLGQAMLRARPRAEVERERSALIAKAAGSSIGHADALRRKAQELLEQHPPAPRRGESRAVDDAMRVAKSQGKPDDLTVVYDSTGNPVGVISASDIQPVIKVRADEAAQFERDNGLQPGSIARALGGTTGLGLPRNAPQQELPGDVPGRQVIKSGKASRQGAARPARDSGSARPAFR